MNKSTLEKRVYILTHTLLFMLVIALLCLMGCTTKPIKEVVINKEVVVETIPDELFKPCQISPLIDKEHYVSLECSDRAIYLAQYASDLLYDLKQCQVILLTLKTYNEDVKKLHDNPK